MFAHIKKQLTCSSGTRIAAQTCPPRVKGPSKDFLRFKTCFHNLVQLIYFVNCVGKHLECNCLVWFGRKEEILPLSVRGLHLNFDKFLSNVDHRIY